MVEKLIGIDLSFVDCNFGEYKFSKNEINITGKDFKHIYEFIYFYQTHIKNKKEIKLSIQYDVPHILTIEILKYLNNIGNKNKVVSLKIMISENQYPWGFFGRGSCIDSDNNDLI